MPPKKIPCKITKKIPNKRPIKNKFESETNKVSNEEEIRFQLNTECILNVPLQNYGDDFTFIVNKKEFKTKSLISDLLSQKISKIHSVDPTFNQFEITTKNQGDFSYILDLTRFGSTPLPEKEIPFIAEVSEALGLNSISSKELSLSTKLSEENVFSLLENQIKYQALYSRNIEEYINFISENFYTICETKPQQLKSLDFDILLRIFSNKNLKLLDEDQLLHFINDFYTESEDPDISYLYSFVQFSSVNDIESFLNTFDYNDINKDIWDSLSNRLMCKISTNDENSDRYKSVHYVFEPKKNNIFNGIISYLKKNRNIRNEIEITTSSHDYNHPPINVIEYDNNKKWFITKNRGFGNWICFNFKNVKITPTNYQLKYYRYDIRYKDEEDEEEEDASNYPFSWEVEGSNDNFNWEKLDEQNNCKFNYNNDYSRLFTIPQNKRKQYSYIRIKNTASYLRNNNYLMLGAVEFYGNLN